MRSALSRTTASLWPCMASMTTSTASSASFLAILARDDCKSRAVRDDEGSEARAARTASCRRVIESLMPATYSETNQNLLTIVHGGGMLLLTSTLSLRSIWSGGAPLLAMAAAISHFMLALWIAMIFCEIWLSGGTKRKHDGFPSSHPPSRRPRHRGHSARRHHPRGSPDTDQGRPRGQLHRPLCALPGRR